MGPLASGRRWSADGALVAACGRPALPRNGRRTAKGAGVGDCGIRPISAFSSGRLCRRRTCVRYSGRPSSWRTRADEAEGPASLVRTSPTSWDHPQLALRVPRLRIGNENAGCVGWPATGGQAFGPLVERAVKFGPPNGHEFRAQFNRRHQEREFYFDEEEEVLHPRAQFGMLGVHRFELEICLQVVVLFANPPD